MTWNVACPDVWAPQVRDVIQAAAPAEFAVEFLDPAVPGSRETILGRCDFMLAGPNPVNRATFAAAPRLQLVHNWGVGVDRMDLRAAEEAGIAIAITAGANAIPVSEHTIMLMIGALRRISLVDRAMRDGRWMFTDMRVVARGLAGSTVGIVGLGNVGKRVAYRLANFDADVVYYDPIRPVAAVEAALGVRYVPFAELLSTADIVTIHCPGGGSNRHLFDAGTIASMKPGAVLVNAARGDIVDTDALAAALLSGQLSAAGLDVFDKEPIVADNPLLKLDNVVLSPHTAASVFDNVANIARHAYRNMRRYALGEPLPPEDIVVEGRRAAPAVSR